ncbi:nuclear transport factor 2 family protein [Sphingobacterium sp. HMA12]|uniref:nuclear transport factor 2 family protein n=1 Tax=Sphingobacterium sp. HMA12 TaxID=2050894 RepID=UPI000CEA0CB2|nr:nuclear transport factor 2 family protein [Sphingobacterium sp. HMA12]
MKALVKTFVAVAMIAVSSLAIAADKTFSKSEKAIVNLFTADIALNHYVAVITEGESTGLEQLFTADFSQKIQSANAITNDRKEVVKFLKKQRGEKLNCKVNTQIIQESADYMVAKVTMQFEGFTKTDLVTLVNEHGAWRVSSSINAYK